MKYSNVVGIIEFVTVGLMYKVDSIRFYVDLLLEENSKDLAI
jgi:uncharacterized protein YkvS